MKKLILMLLSLVLTYSIFAAEHPVLKGMKNFSITKEKTEDYGELIFYVKEDGKKKIRKTVGGKYFVYNYLSNEGVDKISLITIIKNYKDEVLKKNGEIYNESSSTLAFSIGVNNSSKIWAKLICSNSGKNKTSYRLEIIEEGGFTKMLSFGEEEIKAAIEKDGKVALYGILFDTGSAVLKESSSEELRALVSVLKEDDEMKIEIGGHTDSDGNDDANLKLSLLRAEQVKRYLELFGIVSSRIVPKGYGETVPVGDNTTEEGKAKNRRVEIVKLK